MVPTTSGNPSEVSNGPASERTLGPMSDDLLRHRKRFPILDDTTYLVNHSLGAMSDESSEALAQYATEWATRGVRAWSEGWWDTPVSVGNGLAPIVGAPAGSIAMVQNVAVAQEVIASCLTLHEPRNRVVFSELNFPSVMYLWHNVPGAHITTVRSWDGIGVPTEAFLVAIDERTAIVPLSHVLFRSGYLQDVEQIIARAHEMGAYVVLDCYQSAGTLPFSLEDLDVDFAVGGSVKWLCGGPGAGWLYVRPDLQEVFEPRFVGWQADQEPFAFVPGKIRYAEGIWRYLSGTPNVPALYAAAAGYRIIQEVGVPAIRERSLEMTDRLIEFADEHEIPVTSERHRVRRGGTVTLGVPNEAAVAETLAAQDIIVDSRPNAGVRVGPHFYNSDEDLATFEKALLQILRK